MAFGDEVADFCRHAQQAKACAKPVTAVSRKGIQIGRATSFISAVLGVEVQLNSSFYFLFLFFNTKG